MRSTLKAGSSASRVGTRIVDADNHYYEPDDAWSRHIDPAFRNRCIHIRRGADGVGRPYFGAEPLYYLERTPLDLVGRPGVVAGDKDGRYRPLAEKDLVRPGEVPWFVHREARLAWMDEQEIEAVLLWPSLGLAVEHQMRSQPDACVANLRAFNRWLAQDWGFAYENRIFGVPWLSLIDLDLALEALDEALALGARAIALLFGPVAGRSPADPAFDPFWARVSEAGLLVGFHGAESGYNEQFSVAWGEHARPPAGAQSPFQRACFFGERPIADTLAALVLHNLFGRFPELQVISVENGAWWAPALLSAIDRGARSGAYGHWLGGSFDERPSDVFRRHITVAPNDDDDIRQLVDLLGADRIALGSDYPHPEGAAEPRRFLDGAGLTEQETRLVAHDNVARLLGLPVDA
jgi:predicted TIM-barrel fold metal-dependent hydrolase